MNIIVALDLEAALISSARKQGVAPEELALQALRERFLNGADTADSAFAEQPVPPKKFDLPPPRDEWERKVRELATDCGVSLSDWAVSREGIYE